MSLAFLSVAAAGATARSPMHTPAAAAGARFEERDGWRVPVTYGDDPDAERQAAERTVGWADVSHLPKLELQGPAPALAAASGGRLGVAGVAGRGDDAWWCRLTPERAIVVGGAPALRERLAASEPAVDVLDVTTTFAAVTVIGPQAREVFARFCALDLRPQVSPVGALRPGSVARQPAVLVCEAADRYLFWFGAATAEYVWSVVQDAAEHLGGRPIGLDALGAVPATDAGTEARHA